jgi:hypothetical protein
MWGQWFKDILTGAEQYRTCEFYDNVEQFGGSWRSWLAIEGHVFLINYDPEIPFAFLKIIEDQQDKRETRSHCLGEKGQGYAKRIYTGAIQSTELIDALLALSRTRYQELNLSEIDMEKLAEELMDLLEKETDRIYEEKFPSRPQVSRQNLLEEERIIPDFVPESLRNFERVPEGYVSAFIFVRRENLETIGQHGLKSRISPGSSSLT